MGGVALGTLRRGGVGGWGCGVFLWKVRLVFAAGTLLQAESTCFHSVPRLQEQDQTNTLYVRTGYVGVEVLRKADFSKFLYWLFLALVLKANPPNSRHLWIFITQIMRSHRSYGPAVGEGCRLKSNTLPL